ncbi:U3 small nucleolar ribonucleoprotein protein MPP10 isoform X1 [Erpetoichthys calabaricus]|uniref:U3 small nucleolar ribonucleoprotein protein MPP10 isoform X1 n=1 Tax=Erpetoichthys calabaricus TaxID=27687 RepID=UPI002234D1DD|nr:U3 small nucleolar ribonucleoprotein protein MPP10 isoform X1 [Erpetoichthys calabaricus]
MEPIPLGTLFWDRTEVLPAGHIFSANPHFPRERDSAMARRVVSSTLEKSLKIINENTVQPEKFLSVQDGLASEFTTLTKTLYDLHKVQELEDGVGSPLKELVIECFDEEQIWQELELQNSSVISYFENVIAGVLKSGTLDLMPQDEEDDEDDISMSEDDAEGEDSRVENGDDEAIDEELSEEEDGHEPARDRQKLKEVQQSSDEDDSDTNFDVDALEKHNKQSVLQKKKKGGKSAIDDRFFKLAEMEVFLNEMDKEDEGGGSDIDYFQQLSSGDDELEEGELFSASKKKKTQKQNRSTRDLKYDDFFDPVDSVFSKKEKNFGRSIEKDNEEMDEDEMIENDDNLDDNEEWMEEKDATKRVTFNVSEDSEGEDVTDILGGKAKAHDGAELKSSFEKRQEMMSDKIKTLEKAALDEKPWQLTGEVLAQKRPENSLLEEDLSFDQAAKMAPVITEETTIHLEDIIKQRIKDQVWDDVVRKEKPKEDTFEYKKRLTLNHEKSKLSLAEVYEQEYLKQNKQKAEEEENPAHTEIQKLMDSLFLKLDALSNFHFIPKPAAPEIKIVSNLPSIAMEEVAPVSISNATLLAPEEIKEKNKAGDIKGETEKSVTDKKRERRKKKLQKKFRLREKAKRLKLKEKKNEGKNIKFSQKEAAQKLKKLAKEGTATLLKDDGKDKALRSSQAFFSVLQDQVKMQIKGAKNEKSKKKKKKEVSAVKLKL